ncbi:DUF805 domain-containing protein [Rathayibacter iranicus]|uniref:DUF805 domain-containing protein n=2 Tax=Rathayibacter iranicus TaxID=59737 RepID=A0AAD1EMT8_9MICO|nr:DUF805 domain-containing protein [Rathayibacter iranicus]AZZ56446.1 DUF805 domain-containing protein [Rathayibacter iranicus]MWV31827.1 DUF805 domain-containing protein [Rathayibacter iranicus NCPPB 2253 = VKM Ac-1602]PPI44697.1 DUF805 domain-containing protein [Rathayibacter iranicus]PPI59128.1 DUF805 domain-containing protein [Rathayibacter iranicus]PPI70216.1 DUF805 domain-containing protein [Rathayibacter iranicus]
MSPRTDEPPLSLPYYGASPTAAIRRFFAKYATFSGRASRAEYWWIILAGTIVSTLLGLLDGAGSDLDVRLTPFRSGPVYDTPWVGVLAGAIALATLIPSLALIWRRLHDVNFSGLWILATFVPIAGFVFLVILFVLPPRPEGARFDSEHNIR